MSRVCRVCGSADTGAEVTLRELMYATGEIFSYFPCNACGCLQIADQPDDIARHYANNYYSYAGGVEGGAARAKRLMRDVLALSGPAWAFAGRSWFEKGDLASLRRAKVRRSDRILDLGCGSGELISHLGDIGYARVCGADPFIAENIRHPNGVRVEKKEAAQVDGVFDLVMMHHSLEHIWDQKTLARDLVRLLAPGGRLIVRIPTLSSWAWEHYGDAWVQLDPPRHFYLHSRASIRALLEGTGLIIDAIADDSSELQILGSEKARLGLPLFNPVTHRPDYAEFLPPDMVAAAPGRARALNREGRGDAIAVHARKAS